MNSSCSHEGQNAMKAKHCQESPILTDASTLGLELVKQPPHHRNWMYAVLALKKRRGPDLGGGTGAHSRHHWIPRQGHEARDVVAPILHCMTPPQDPRSYTLDPKP